MQQHCHLVFGHGAAMRASDSAKQLVLSQKSRKYAKIDKTSCYCARVGCWVRQIWLVIPELGVCELELHSAISTAVEAAPRPPRACDHVRPPVRVRATAGGEASNAVAGTASAAGRVEARGTPAAAAESATFLGTLQLTKQLLRKGNSVVATTRRINRAAELQQLAEQPCSKLTITELDVSASDSIKVAFECKGVAK